MKKTFKHFSSPRGFTLIEILIVIGLLSVIGTISVAVITVTLRGAKKTDLLNFANQNGDAALSQMVKNIRYAQTLNTPATCVPTTTVSSITITSFSDHQQTTYSCANNTISSNSASLLDINSLRVSSCSFVCSQASTLVPPIITIQFVLVPKTAGSFEETNFSLPFQSSVTLRNY
jgi:prepilin-type N-terminal cleavage/methylation domain-containing protein